MTWFEAFEKKHPTAAGIAITIAFVAGCVGLWGFAMLTYFVAHIGG